MRYAQPLDAAADLSGLPAVLIPDPSTLRILVNCYQLCRANQVALGNL